MAEGDRLLDTLRSAIRLACQPQSIRRIVAGRKQVLDLPHDLVLENIESVAVEVLDLSDYWEYRRLLELAAMLGHDRLIGMIDVAERAGLEDEATDLISHLNQSQRNELLSELRDRDEQAHQQVVGRLAAGGG